jgi:DNA-binding beta-propeller fold protein YncE
MSLRSDSPPRVRLLLALIFVAATAATISAHPGSGIVVGPGGRVFFVDTGGGVWVVEPSGGLAHYGDPRFHWMALAPGARPSGSPVPSIPAGEITPVGTDPTLLVSSDVPIAVGRDGTLYYPEAGRDQRLRIMRFTPSGVRSVFALLPVSAHRWINGLAAGPNGSLYYTEDKAIRRIDRRGAVSTVVENVSVPDCASIPGTDPGIEPYLRGLDATADGTVFVAAAGCGAVLEIKPRGKITTVLRTTSPWSPTAVAISPGGVYVLEYTHTAEEIRRAWVPRVRKILPDGRIVDIAAVQRQ